MFWQTDLDIARTADFEERMRLAARDRKLRIALAAKCARNGCHPIYERISRSMLRLAVRFHRWAAPEMRRTAVQMAADPSALTSSSPHGWT